MKYKVGDYVAFCNEVQVFNGHNKDIWRVKSINPNDNKVDLQSICRERYFSTNSRNLTPIEFIWKDGKLTDKYFNPISLLKFKELTTKDIYNKGNFTESKKMNSNNDMVNRTMNTNTQAAKVAATITAGKTLNGLVANKVTPQLPMFVKGYADTALGRVVIANIADFAVKQFMPGNAKANLATDAMMQAAMLELADSFDLEGIVTELVDSVVVPELD